MKKFLGFIFVLGIMILTFSNVDAYAKTVGFRQDYAIMQKNKTKQLKLYNVSGDVTWSSSNTNIATVSNGIVTTKKTEGVCIITAKNNSHTYNLYLTVATKATANVLKYICNNGAFDGTSTYYVEKNDQRSDMFGGKLMFSKLVYNKNDGILSNYREFVGTRNGTAYTYSLVTSIDIKNKKVISGKYVYTMDDGTEKIEATFKNNVSDNEYIDDKVIKIVNGKETYPDNSDGIVHAQIMARQVPLFEEAIEAATPYKRAALGFKS